MAQNEISQEAARALLGANKRALAIFDEPESGWDDEGFPTQECNEVANAVRAAIAEKEDDSAPNPRS